LPFSTRKLTREQKLALFLIKIKLNLTFTVLGALFCVKSDTASYWFYETLKAMTSLARRGVWWFDRETIKARMPAAFREYDSPTLSPATQLFSYAQLFFYGYISEGKNGRQK
jgi:hypothetical protein